MNDTDETRRNARERLQADARECRVHSAALDALVAALAAPRVTDVATMSRRALSAAVPLLAANAVRAYRRRLARSLLLSLSPLPVVAFFNMVMLREAYALLSSWLPDSVVAWLVVGYAAMLLLLCALTYAALPLLIARARVDAAATA